MGPQDLVDRLSRIQTHWTVVFQAHEERGQTAVTAAQQQLVLRYRGAVYRYLLGMVRDPAAAEELAQDFAVRLLRGDFRRADPGRGRFRDFLKAAVRHLVIDYWREQGKAPVPLDPAAVAVGPAEEADLDRPFLERWREELLNQTWDALEEVQARTGQPYHTVLRWKTEQPEQRSAQMAQRLSAHQGRPVTENALRKLLHRARKLFADLLVDEVARSLGTSAPEPLEQELIDLDLLDYCRSALERRQAPPS
jgi:RNA polymerase sigma-70 factor (ECF subfamily)